MRTGLVLEGGAMRGMFTCGILDVFLEKGIDFDSTIGVSAGAVFGCNYKSRQVGRALRYNKRFCRDPRYCSGRSLLKTGDLYGAEFCYDELPNELDPFDYDTFERNPMEFWCVTTDVETGKARYDLMKDGRGDDMKLMRASASMPLVSRPVSVRGRELLDGGIADPIPFDFMLSGNVDRCLVILTQPYDYIKKKNSMLPLFGLFYKGKRKGIRDAMGIRHEVYNSQTERLKTLEKEGRVFVLRPASPLEIGKTEKDPSRLQAVYDEGRRLALEKLDEINAYIS
ncbi:MAG: patatin family protein [Spirochaetales bacterium]|nr:patatin family protein [Spirochaetales bacterium]